MFDVDKVLPSNELNAHLVSFQNSPATVYAISDRISDHVTFLGFDETEFGILENAIDECRVVKDSYEIALIRKANEISTLAHVAVQKEVKTYKNEREIEATFVGTCIRHGARAQAYHSICATGTSCATLHYIKNYESLEGKLNVLLDAGGEYNCYCADITRTFPISGTWSAESKEIYDIVDEMQSSCFKMLKEGVMWEDVHINAHKVAIKGLKKLGILKGSDEELLAKRISVAFFPHGLGHMLGMDTHDTGGHANYEDKDIMFRYLRVRGTLKAGTVITNEPGIYFCNFIIDPYLEDEATSKYIDKDVLDRYWDVGGVRIEDNVHITKEGYENLTNTPKL